MHDDATRPFAASMAGFSGNIAFISSMVLLAMLAACLTLTGCAESSGRDYDPWEPVNARVFAFNYDLVDHYGMKPAATAWSRILTPPVTEGLANAFDNVDMPKRFVNNVLQGRFVGAGREMARFVVNSTVGVAGVFDVATELGLEKSYADFGQTLGTYDIGPGPYLMVPFMQPLTVRDAIGFGADSFLDPISYFAPFVANVSRAAAKRVNERANSLDMYQDVEETSLDLYAAVRNGYLQRREHSIRRAVIERDNEPEWAMLRNRAIEDTDRKTSEDEVEDSDSDPIAETAFH